MLTEAFSSPPSRNINSGLVGSCATSSAFFSTTGPGETTVVVAGVSGKLVKEVGAIGGTGSAASLEGKGDGGCGAALASGTVSGSGSALSTVVALSFD